MGILDPLVIQRETFGAKLRRLARQAEVSNPISKAPWTVPAAWQANTAYKDGNVVSNAGSWYVCVVAGTSASSGGPNNTGTGNTIADGSASWTYIGGPTLSASDPDAPTVTTTLNASSLPNYMNVVSYPGAFRFYGCYTQVYSTSYLSMLCCASNGVGGTVSGGAVAFETDAPKVAIGFTNASPAQIQITIDGRQYSAGGIDIASGGSPAYVIADFSATSARKRRSYLVEGKLNYAMTFAGVRVDASSQVWAPTTTDDVRAAFVSDSVWAGSSYGPMLPGGQIARRIGKLLGWADCWNATIGGTGYIANQGGGANTYGQRVADLLQRNPDVWLFMGSTNDIGQTPAAIQAAALASFQSIRNAGNTAPIIVFGVWPLNNSGVSQTEAAVQAAVTQFADPLGKTFFIPLYADPILPWITGAWNNAANTSSANSTLYISGDGTHPPDMGTAYLSHRMARAIRTNVLPNIK